MTVKMWSIDSDVPEAAVRLLAAVRETGRTNMWDSGAALEIAEEFVEEERLDGIDAVEGYAAIDWMDDGGNYVKALKLMGKARQEGRLA